MKIKTLLLALIMTLSLLPAEAFASQPPAPLFFHAEGTAEEFGPTALPADTSGLASAAEQTDPQITEAIAAVRETLKNRRQTVTVNIKGYPFSESKTIYTAILAGALAHTGKPTEGDYIKWHYGGWKVSIEGFDSDFDMVFTFEQYLSTAEQEAAVDAAANELLASLDLDGKDSYTKVKTIYDWICSHITYDYSGSNISHTAYAALINRSCVCQGYASLLYRLALSAGVDCRVISGKTSRGDHGWNIVKIDEKYYDLDSTWDANFYPNYRYFLVCDNNFPDHNRADDYSTSEFNALYPMGESDYVYTGPVSVEGIDISQSELFLTEGETAFLDFDIYPENAADKRVVWSSSNEAAVSVRDGIVTANSAGEAEITVKTVDGGFSAVCTVFVEPAASEDAVAYTVDFVTAEPRADGVLVKAVVTKNRDREGEDAVVIAVYSEGALADMLFMEAEFAEGQTVSFGGTLPSFEGAVYRAFVWDDLDGMVPLSNVAVNEGL